MAHIVDRRLNGKGKSLVNRGKFIERVKGTLKRSVQDIIRNGSIKDLASKDKKKVRIPIRNLDEPHFHTDGTGVSDIVRPGNDRFSKGDKIKRPEEGQGSGNGGSPDGEGEDGFSFSLSKEEFMDIFFDNCALPDLVKQSLAVIDEETTQRVGFTSDGSPSAMNIMRSMRGAKARRSGLRALKTKKLRELEAREAELISEITQRTAQGLDVSLETDALNTVQHDIEVVKRRIKAVPFIDPMDLRFNNWSKVSTPSTQAAMVCVMDVSGSMDDVHKELAKTFYLLLYLFLDRNYQHIDITYITYHSQAKVVEEEEFYYGKDSGGTVTSTALELAYNTIVSNYPTDQWNVYLAHASDGDNWYNDNELTTKIIEYKLLPLLQYYAYIHVDPYDRNVKMDDPHSLWPIMHALSETNPKLNLARTCSQEDIYPVFVKLFKKKVGAA